MQQNNPDKATEAATDTSDELIRQSVGKTQQPKEKHSDEPRMNFLYRWVCWCSGARLYLLKRCPTDYNRFFGIGLVVIMTGVMASISGGFALFTIFQQTWIAIVFGLFWGTLIFALDWYIVSSLRKEQKKGREFLHAAPRFILALLIALVISKPLELKLFEKEINQELVMMQTEQLSQYQSTVTNQYPEIEELQAANEQLREAIRRKEQEQQALYQAIIAEAEGRSPTARVGKGPVYKEKKQAYDRVLDELYWLRQKNNERIALNQLRIQELKDKRDQQLQRGEQATVNTDGFLARLHAISRMTERDQAIRFTNYFIILLFIFIESSPMIVKLLSRRGVYDRLIDYQEYRAGQDIERKLERVRFSKEDYYEYLQAIHKHRFHLQLEADKVLIDKTFQVKQQVDDERIEKWRQAKEQELANDTDTYVQMIERIVDKDFTLYP